MLTLGSLCIERPRGGVHSPQEMISHYVIVRPIVSRSSIPIMAKRTHQVESAGPRLARLAFPPLPHLDNSSDVASFQERLKWPTTSLRCDFSFVRGRKHLLSQNIASMLLNQPIEIKWNQEMSGNAEDSDGWQKGSS